MLHYNTTHLEDRYMLEYRDTPQFISDFRRYLEANGITNAHVARKMGISPQQLQNVYKKRELTITDVTSLCGAIGYTCKLDISKNDIDAE